MQEESSFRGLGVAGSKAQVGGSLDRPRALWVLRAGVGVGAHTQYVIVLWASHSPRFEQMSGAPSKGKKHRVPPPGPPRGLCTPLAGLFILPEAPQLVSPGKARPSRRARRAQRLCVRPECPETELDDTP